MIPSLVLADEHGGQQVLRPTAGAFMVWERLSAGLPDGQASTWRMLTTLAYVTLTRRIPGDLAEVEAWAVAEQIGAPEVGPRSDPTDPAP